MISFNSLPVDSGSAACGSGQHWKTVDNNTRHTQGSPVSKNSVHYDFSGLSTSSTGPSTTTLFFFNSSNN